MTKNKELTRYDIVIDPDMDIEDDGQTVAAYVETCFDVDQKFGTHIAEEPETWINFYVVYNVETEDLEAGYVINRPEGTEWHNYSPTEKEKHLIVAMMEECCRAHHGCSLAEYVCG